MFNLKIQSPNQPTYNPVAGCEICRGLDLVNGHSSSSLYCRLIGHRESSMLNGVRQLKYNTQNETRHQCKNEKNS
jgi:hypothetical protein